MIGTINMERKGYYNRNGWGIESREVMGHGNESFEKDLINRDKGNGKREEQIKI